MQASVAMGFQASDIIYWGLIFTLFPTLYQEYVMGGSHSERLLKCSCGTTMSFVHLFKFFYPAMLLRCHGNGVMAFWGIYTHRFTITLRLFLYSWLSEEFVFISKQMIDPRFVGERKLLALLVFLWDKSLCCPIFLFSFSLGRFYCTF